MMRAITKAQRAAIKRIFDRGPVFANDASATRIAQENGWTFVHFEDHGWFWRHHTYMVTYRDAADIVIDYRYALPLTYRQFRKTVQHGFDCLMVQWCGLTLGIEPDGYVHS